MKTNLLFIVVIAMLAANDIEDRAKKVRPALKQARERFWEKYDNAVKIVLDELEIWGILRNEDYSTKKD